MEKYESTIYEKNSLRLNMSEKKHTLHDIKQGMKYSEFSLVGEISRYLNVSCIQIAKIIREATDGIDKIVKAVNTHNEILEDIIIPKIFIPCMR